MGVVEESAPLVLLSIPSARDTCFSAPGMVQAGPAVPWAGSGHGHVTEAHPTARYHLSSTVTGSKMGP